MKLKNLFLVGSISLATMSQATTIPFTGGSNNGVAICKNHEVYAWGSNEIDSYKNLLGLDTTTSEYMNSICFSPQLVNRNGIIFKQVESIAGYYNPIMAVSNKGIVYYWGVMNNTLNTQPTPFKSNQNNGYNEDGTLGGEFLGNVKKIKGSDDKFMVLLNDSISLIYTEENGIDTIKNEQGEVIENIIDISARDNSFFILTSEGTMYGSGSWDGHGSSNIDKVDSVNVMKPVLLEKTMEPLKNVVGMSAGCVCSFAVTKDGKAFGWGDGGWGGCPGVGERKSITYAKPILAGDYKKISGLDYLSNVKQVGAGRGYGVAITFDGYLLYWGNNDGNGGVAAADRSEEALEKPIFLTYKDGSIVNDAVAIECGHNFAFVVNKKNEYFAFGLNDMGQCGISRDEKIINYLQPMIIPCELGTPCPSVHLLGDTTTICSNDILSIEAFVSSIAEETDYTLSWFLNGEKLAATTPSYDAESEGEYKIVMTPKDSLCAITSSYIYVKHEEPIITSIDSETILSDIEDIKNQDLIFDLHSEKETNLVIFSDENCTELIDSISVVAGENSIKVAGAVASVEENGAHIWAKEVIQTTMYPKEEFDGAKEGSIFMNQGVMLQTINNAKLRSFKCKFKTIFGSSEISITPFIYKAYEENTQIMFESYWEGKKQIFSIDDKGTECTITCDTIIPNNGIYVVGMELEGSGYIIYTQNVLASNQGSSPLFNESISDINNLGIEWVGNTMVSTSGIPMQENSYYDIVFTDIESSNCGATKLTTLLTTTTNIKDAFDAPINPDTLVDVYNANGILLKKQVKYQNAFDRLKSGIYMINGVKIIYVKK